MWPEYTIIYQSYPIITTTLAPLHGPLVLWSSYTFGISCFNWPVDNVSYPPRENVLNVEIQYIETHLPSLKTSPSFGLQDFPIITRSASRRAIGGACAYELLL